MFEATFNDGPDVFRVWTEGPEDDTLEVCDGEDTIVVSLDAVPQLIKALNDVVRWTTEAKTKGEAK